MDWVVAVSASETAGGELTPETDAAARAALQEHGCILLRGAFPAATIEAMYQEYAAQLGTLDLAAIEAEAKKPPPNRIMYVGGARYDTTLRMTGTYHQFGTFISGVASLPRVVILTLHDVSLTPKTPSKDGSAGGQLVLQGTVKTYRYLDDEESATAAAGSKGKTGGAK